MEPIISIICPVYNSKDYLKEAIVSVLEQTDNMWELILVDDGSTDGSEIICDNFSLLDKRIKVFHKTNDGQMNARLDGINHSTGNYIMFLDSDDLLGKNAIEIIRKVIVSNNSIDAILFNASTFPKKDKNKTLPFVERKKLLKKNDDIINYAFCNQMFGYLWMYCLRRDVIESNLQKHVFLTNIRYTEDGMFIYRLISTIDTLQVTNSSLYCYRDNDASITHNLTQKDRYDRYCVFNYIYKNIHEKNRRLVLGSRLAENISWSIFSYLEHFVNREEFKKAFKECRDSFLFKKVCRKVKTKNTLFKAYRLLLMMKLSFVFYKIAHRKYERS